MTDALLTLARLTDRLRAQGYDAEHLQPGVVCVNLPLATPAGEAQAVSVGLDWWERADDGEASGWSIAYYALANLGEGDGALDGDYVYGPDGEPLGADCDLPVLLLALTTLAEAHRHAVAQTRQCVGSWGQRGFYCIACTDAADADGDLVGAADAGQRAYRDGDRFGSRDERCVACGATIAYHVTD